MAPALADLLAPPTTAVIAMEMQRGVTGDLAMMTELRDLMVASGVIDNVAAVVRGARTAGARVVHCRAISRPDGAGRKNNARILAATAASARAMLDGSAAAEVIPELGVEPADIDMPRLHGLTPFTGTSLDRVLRNLGVDTVVVTGNSVNIGVLGTVLSAVDLGYQVVVPHDAVAGIPVEYAEAVMANTISLLATVTSTEELLAAWA